MEILLLILITGFFYMILPFIFVKRRGKTTSGKAFLLAFINWLIIHFIFLAIYYAIFPDDAGTTANSVPALWLFVAWRYMTVKNVTKNITSHNTSPNSIDNIERKFNLNLSDTLRETLTRGTIKFALFTFKLGRTNLRGDKFKYLVVVYDPANDFRYFAVESSFTGTNMLCEWIFDDQDKEIGHLNYGGVALSEFDSSAQEVIEKSSEEVLIDQILAIITMKVEPEFKSMKNESSWIETGKKTTVQGNQQAAEQGNAKAQNNQNDDDNEHKKDFYDNIKSDKLKMPVLSSLLFVFVIVIFIASISINYDNKIERLKTEAEQIWTVGNSAFIRGTINKSYPVYLIEEGNWIYIIQIVGNEIRPYKVIASYASSKPNIIAYFNTVMEEDIPARDVLPSLHLSAILITVITGLIMISAWVYYFQKEKNIFGFPKKTDSKENPTDTGKSSIPKTLENFEHEFGKGIKADSNKTEASSQRLGLLNSLGKSSTLSDSQIMLFSNKFRVDFTDATKKVYSKNNLEYTVISLKHLSSELMNLKHLVIVEVQSTHRYFATELSFFGSYMLCEWIFDENDNNIGHFNYGGVALSMLDSTTQKINSGEEVLIEQISTIIAMKVEPDFTSSKNESGWEGTQRKPAKDIHNLNEELNKNKPNLSEINSNSPLNELLNLLHESDKQAVYGYQKEAEQGNADAQFNLGSCYYNGRGVVQDYKQAVYWFQKAAQQGFADAEYNLGICYNKGRGVAQDYQQAVYWFQKAAEQGVAEAQYNLGFCYNNGQGVVQDYKKAVIWFQKAAEQGVANAQNNLGGCYNNGQGVVQDYKQAVYWFQKAAEQGNADAQCNLAYCYSNERGVTQDYEKAFYFFQKAAEQGVDKAQLYLGHCYYNGENITQDYQKAIYWCRQAANQGSADALFYLGSCYYHGKGVIQDFQQGVSWFEQAALLGHSVAQFNLGSCLYNGKGATQDYQQAFYWFQQAADQGYASAQTYLGACYYKGQGVAQNYQQAVYWYKKAAEQGDAYAQYNLGVCYKYGEGIAQNDKRAVYWLKKAAEQGLTSAIKLLSAVEIQIGT